MTTDSNKIAIIGAGNVGSTLAYTIVISRIANEIVLVDKNEEKAAGEAMDLNDGLSFIDSVNIYPGDYSDIAGAKIIIITAGATQKVGETRIDLLNRNIVILKDMIDNILKYNKSAILLIVTNPVDVLSYAAFRFSKFESQRVIGSGTVLDTSRLRFLIGKHCQVNPRNVHTYVIGEHGDSEFALWDHAVIGGASLKDFSQLSSDDKHPCNNKNDMNRFVQQTKDAAYKIIKAKGSTYYAIALAVRSIISSILHNESSILCTSNLINDYYGVNEVYLGTPAIIDITGVRALIKLRFSTEEKNCFIKSANKIKKLIKQLNL